MPYTPENNPYIPGDPYSYDLKWIVDHIKEALSLYRPLHDEFEDLQSDFEFLRNYVDNYFDTLDVSAEVTEAVNNILTDWYASGYLLALLQPSLDGMNAQIAQQNETIDTLESRVDQIVATNTTNLTGWNVVENWQKVAASSNTISYTWTDIPDDAVVLETSYQRALVGDTDPSGALQWYEDMQVWRSYDNNTIQLQKDSFTASAYAFIKLVYAVPQTVVISELEDIRVGADGVTYDTAGNSVRGQIGTLASESTKWYTPLLQQVNGSINAVGNDYGSAANRRRNPSRIKVHAGDYLTFDTTTYKSFVAFYTTESGGNGTSIKNFSTTLSTLVIQNDGYIRVAWGRQDDADLAASEVRSVWNVYQLHRRATETLFETPLLMERGGVSTANYITDYGLLGNTANLHGIRSPLYKNIAASNLRIYIPYDSNIQYLSIFRYSADFAVRSDSSWILDPTKNYIDINIGDANYFMIGVSYSTDIDSWNQMEMSSDGVVVKSKIPDISTVSVHRFMYSVTPSLITSGRLILPPNYDIEGVPVPLIVFVHGSDSYTTWNGSFPSAYLTYLQYLANEGFAIFDCYPWTNRITASTWSPIAIPINKQAYLTGIKYVCERYNIDINNVSLICKSQGGNIGHWACVTDDFDFKAVALFAPTTDPRLQQTGQLFYNEACRRAIATFTTFKGTETEIDAFITSGSVSNPDVISFIEKNKNTLLSMLPLAFDICGYADYNDIVDESIDYITTTPSWQLAEGLPPRVASVYDLIPAFANHSDKAKHAKRAVKFWCAFDDASTSSYGNYALYRYLLNGGSDADFRELPIGTGGHHAMDSDANALKSSGTTRLGIAYSNIPTAYVETADFFYEKMIL